MTHEPLTRRSFLAATLLAVGNLSLTSCSDAPAQGTSSDMAEPEPDDGATAGASPSSATGTTLVACFSATGNTRAVAQVLARHLDASYVELEPAEPYSDTDLDYRDDTTRATTEQHDAAARPALAALPDVSPYDTILLGHPIWWGMAPRLICTLLEGVDLSGKAVAEFCTSGGSGVESAASELQELAPSVTWLDAHRFAAGAPKEEITAWADTLGL